ncbi:Pr6Pr family membrane protein [Corynebacterium sp. H128]|uniref:Pr6Pr family membrane protein n=1 Tax=unclassified Corynebacterium TaxID=2624378 RepID=UPI0030A83ED8
MRTLVRRTGTLAGLLGGVAVALSGYQAATTTFQTWPAFKTPQQKLIAHYSYFTLWSNIIGTVVSAQYAVGKRPTRLAFLRIDAVTMLAITGVVFNTLLAKTTVVEGLGKITNPIVHTIMPIAVPSLWLLDRPSAPTKDVTPSSAAFAFAIPILWAGYTFGRGAQTEGYYPYDFLNPTILGYPTAVRNVCAVGAAIGALICAMAAAEHAVA